MNFKNLLLIMALCKGYGLFSAEISKKAIKVKKGKENITPINRSTPIPTEAMESFLNSDKSEFFNGFNQSYKKEKIGKDFIDIHLLMGGNINDKFENGETLLIMVAKRGLVEHFAYVISKGADLGIKDKFGRTALDWAKINAEKLSGNQRKSYIEIIEYSTYIQQESFYLNQTIQAIRMHNIEENQSAIPVIEQFLKAAGNINGQNNDGSTMLIVASKLGHFDIVEYLLDNNADVCMQDKYGMTALMYVSREFNSVDSPRGEYNEETNFVKIANALINKGGNKLIQIRAYDKKKSNAEDMLCEIDELHYKTCED